MAVYEVLTSVLIITLAITTVVAIYLGLLNWIGGVYVVRCAGCRHLAFSSANRSRASCPHCRHPVLTHPVHALRHRDTRTDVRVIGDRLHY